MKPWRFIAIVLVAVASFPLPLAADDLKLPFVTDKEILDELKAAPRDNVERVEFLRGLYLKAGAKEDDVRLQEVKGFNDKQPVLHNVIVTKKGQSDSVIVVGGHLDKVPPGDGIIDDWSGACLAQNLYQTIRPLETKHTFVFIGFAYEENGMVGSKAYVAALSADEKKRIKAMVNLECLGVDDPFIWTNGSTDSLEAVAHAVADEHKLPLRDHEIQGVGADSMSFEAVGIPNITFDGVSVPKVFGLIHSPNDTFDKINKEAYLNAYRFTSRFLVTLDQQLAANPRLLTAVSPNVAAKKVDDYIVAEIKKRHIPGCSVAVVQSGEVVLAKGYGQANVELDVPASAESVYQIGSITKQFTATAIMMLVEDGKLATDDPISKWLDKSPDAWNDVTVRHLLNHTSGIKSYTSIPDNMAKSRLDRSRDDILGTVRDLPLEFAPGDKFAYNNSGYFLLGLIIEKAGGKPYAEFLAERIFRPLDMTATRVNDQSEIVPHRATGYGWRGKMVNAEHTSMSWPFAAGAIVSTVTDLAKWDAALYTERLLPRSRLDEMWTKTKLNDGKNSDYGFGWGVGEVRGHRLISHGGDIAGFSTDIARLVDDKFTVIVLCNLEGANPAAISRGIGLIYLPELAESTKSIEDKDPKTTEFFKKVVKQTIDGELDQELFTDEMRAAIFPDRAKQATGFLKSLGPQKSFTLIERKDDGGLHVHRYRLVFGDTTVILTGALNDDGKIAGLTMTPE